MAYVDTVRTVSTGQFPDGSSPAVWDTVRSIAEHPSARGLSDRSTFHRSPESPARHSGMSSHASVVTVFGLAAQCYGVALARSPPCATRRDVVVWQLGAFAWFSRVPSCCNIVDAPSRLEFGPLSGWPGSQLDVPSFGGVSGRALWAEVALRLSQ